VPGDVTFDVLVVGSGAAGLAAAVSADRAGARAALATKGSLQANNSSKAQGGIQAALGEDDTPELHADDVMRSSHDSADRDLVSILTAEAPGAGTEPIPGRRLRRRSIRCFKASTDAPASGPFHITAANELH